MSSSTNTLSAVDEKNQDSPNMTVFAYDFDGCMSRWALWIKIWTQGLGAAFRAPIDRIEESPATIAALQAIYDATKKMQREDKIQTRISMLFKLCFDKSPLGQDMIAALKRKEKIRLISSSKRQGLLDITLRLSHVRESLFHKAADSGSVMGFLFQLERHLKEFAKNNHLNVADDAISYDLFTLLDIYDPKPPDEKSESDQKRKKATLGTFRLNQSNTISFPQLEVPEDLQRPLFIQFTQLIPYYPLPKEHPACIALQNHAAQPTWDTLWCAARALREAALPTHGKMSMLYAQIHAMATQHPDHKITIKFYDDSEDICGTLALFSKFAHLLPRNVQLQIYRYETAQNNTFSALLKNKPINIATIRGTGNIDKNFKNNTLLLHEILNKNFASGKSLTNTSYSGDALAEFSKNLKTQEEKAQPSSTSSVLSALHTSHPADALSEQKNNAHSNNTEPVEVVKTIETSEELDKLCDDLTPTSPKKPISCNLPS